MKRWLRQPWIVPLALTALGWLWVLSSERAAAHAQLATFAERIEQLQSDNRKARERIAEMHAAIVAIQTDVRWMRDAFEHFRKQTETRDHE